MDFGIDDALDSDDSFFDDPKPLAKRPTIGKTSEKEKKTVDELFNFMDQTTGSKTTEQDNNLQPVKFNIGTTIEKKEKVNKPERKTEFLDPSPLINYEKPFITDTKEDLLLMKPSLRKNPLTDTATKKSSTSITFNDILEDSKINQKTEDLLAPRKSALKISTDQKPTSSFSSLEDLGQTRPSTGRRGSRSTTGGVEDILGIFGTSSEQEMSNIYYNKRHGKEPEDMGSDIKSVRFDKEKKDIPDWLGGSTTATTKSDTTISSEKPEKSTASNLKSSELRSEQSFNSKNYDINDGPSHSCEDKKSDSLVTNINTTTPNYDTLSFQNSYSNLQQQESLLLVSLQMKKYEENLMEIKKRQDELLHKQDNQFEVLVQKIVSNYASQQESVEKDVRLHQERINSYIKMLIGADNPFLKRNMAQETETLEKKEQIDNDSGQHDVVKLLKQRHEEEMFLMEESYKKQISLLEKSAESIERRLNSDMEKITTEFEDKITTLHKTCKEEVLSYMEKIKNIETKHEEEIKIINENHSRILGDLRNDNFKQIQYLKEQMKLEHELLSDKNSYSQRLDESINFLENNSKHLENLQSNVANSYSVFSAARQKSIEAKEKEILLMSKSLEECRGKAESERSQLLGLVRTLETKIAEQNHNAKEERWALTQAAATLAARSAALDRETEYNRVALDRDREQLKTLKEELLQERETAILRLTEEKLQLSAEKQRFEVSKKLTNNFEVEKTKIEAETAIEVAKELAEKLNHERDCLQRQKIEMEQKRKEILERENQLLQRESELEYLTKSAQEKVNVSNKSITESRYIQRKYEEKLNKLNMQTVMLSNKEKKLAEEKLWLSKERLALYNSLNTKGNNQACVLCKNDNVDGSQNLERFISHSIMVDDSQAAVRIRLQLEDDENDKNNEVSREESSVVFNT